MDGPFVDTESGTIRLVTGRGTPDPDGPSEPVSVMGPSLPHLVFVAPLYLW